MDSSFVGGYVISGNISFGITVSSIPASPVIIVSTEGIEDEYEQVSYTAGQILIRPNVDLNEGNSIYINFTYNLRQ